MPSGFWRSTNPGTPVNKLRTRSPSDSSTGVAASDSRGIFFSTLPSSQLTSKEESLSFTFDIVPTFLFPGMDTFSPAVKAAGPIVKAPLSTAASIWPSSYFTLYVPSPAFSVTTPDFNLSMLRTRLPTVKSGTGGFRSESRTFFAVVPSSNRTSKVPFSFCC